MPVSLDAGIPKKNPKTRSAQVITPTMHQTLRFTSAACYFLALLSFLCMKGNSKRDLQHAIEEKVRWGLGVWGERVQQEIDFIVWGR